MRKSVLNWKQVVGLEPISKEEFIAAMDEGIEAVKNGDTVPTDEVFAKYQRRPLSI